ncbi:MAG TPA: glycosyltransferase, partial [Candidatus Krumholzibacteria bacterium]|nr:glycosyltransferase [Candidatus Krumholzibacteria bacterium]
MAFKIGIVCYPTLGGSGVVATELGKSLAALGNEVHFITSGHPSRLTGYDERVYLHKVVTGDYPLFQQYTPYSLSLSVKIREVADQYGLDLVHVHYAIPHATSAFLAREMLKP